MKFTLAYVFTLIVLSVNEASSRPVDVCKHQDPTDGKQLKGGSCSKTFQGEIPSVNHMVSTIITKPSDHAVLSSDKPLHVEILVSHLETGHFSDPDKDYYGNPQELGSGGLIKGHLHVTIQEINTHEPPNPQKFAFFKGVEDKAHDGRLGVDVVQKDGTPGLSPGKYRICTLSSSFSHQPVIMPVAKRGAQDDCIRITVKGRDDKKEKVGKQKEEHHDEVGKQKEEHHDEVGKQKDHHDEVGKQNDVKTVKVKVLSHKAGSE